MQNSLKYFHPAWIQKDTRILHADLCVYGGTSAGIIAAVKGRRLGLSAIICNPGLHLGGLSSGGLGFTDFGNKVIIGGLSRDFYKRIGLRYGLPEIWKFEPHIAESVFHELIKEFDIPVCSAAYLDHVDMTAKRITEISFLGGLRVKAKSFVDATYEGDLMAKARVSYTVGREDNTQYGETCNGFQIHNKHQFDYPVDPYIIPGHPGSGLLSGIRGEDAGPEGRGDSLLQAYNFRVCMTDDPEIRVPFPKPEHYDPKEYTLCARWLASLMNSVKAHESNFLDDAIFRKFDRITAVKTDTNNHGAFSTDYIGANHRWPDAGYEEREGLFQKHVTYQQGLHWFMANDPSVPGPIRGTYAAWGLVKDEFLDTMHWPHQLYIREARRMVSDIVMSERHCVGAMNVDDPVGMGAYQMDSHNCQRIVRDGHVLNEGDVQMRLEAPYAISYRAIIPKTGECENLSVPVCASASHIAFGSIRMEPVFMILAESAVEAAALALKNNASLQDVPYKSLKEKILQSGQIVNVQTKNSGPSNPND